MTISSSRVLFFTAALAFAFMGCPPGGGGGTGGGSGSTGGSGGTTGGGTGTTTGGGTGTTTGGGTGTTTGGGTGTTTGGGTGTTTGGGTGTTGGGTAVTCTEIQFTNFAYEQNDVQNQFVSYSADLSPDTGGTDPDFLSLEFYGNFNAGSFNLATAPDNNYQTCEHCLVVYQDNGAKYFYQKSGTFVVQATDGGSVLNGTLSATLTDSTLVEVTIDDTSFRSTPVDGGACLHVASATINVAHVPPPAGWTCAEQAYGDGDCQCGCGAQDVDCTSTTDITECTGGCGCPTAAADGGVVPSYCDPANTISCLPVSPSWTCRSTFFGDNECDCGCGIADVDCANATVDACAYCSDTGSCIYPLLDAGVGPANPAADGGVRADGCGYIDPANNAVCQALPVVDAGTGTDAGTDVDAGADVDAGVDVDAGTGVDAGP